MRGTLHRFGAEDRAGAVWLDQAADDQVLVRQSRAIGLPAPVPDICGLAVRVPTEGGCCGDRAHDPLQRESRGSGHDRLFARVMALG